MKRRSLEKEREANEEVFLAVYSKCILKLLAVTYADALWSKIEKNTDVSTGPLARPFAHSLAPLTRGTVND